MGEVESVDPTASIVRALATELKVSEEEIVAARSLRSDLKMDSIAAVNVTFIIEDEYDIVIDIDENDEFDSLDAIVAMVRRALAENARRYR